MLPRETSIGVVYLTVTNLDRAIAFYTGQLGLDVRGREGDDVRLGAGDRDLLALRGDRGARRTPGTTGLYHFALVVPTRRDLARSFRRLLESSTRLHGAADHGVSEAVYLADPDGNGIEVYRDRPREEWPMIEGALSMGVDPLDLGSLLEEDGTGGERRAWSGIAPGTRMGHVHLHVADLSAARRFYVDGLGFVVMQQYGTGALFVAAGGYHHHLGLNTWMGVGAPAPPRGSVGLRQFEIVLPDAASLEQAAGRLSSIGAAAESDGRDRLRVSDPSGNVVVLRLAGRADQEH